MRLKTSQPFHGVIHARDSRDNACLTYGKTHRVSFICKAFTNIVALRNATITLHHQRSSIKQPTYNKEDTLRIWQIFPSMIAPLFVAFLCTRLYSCPISGTGRLTTFLTINLLTPKDHSSYCGVLYNNVSMLSQSALINFNVLTKQYMLRLALFNIELYLEYEPNPVRMLRKA